MFVSRYQLQEEDKTTFDEFMKNPFGPHSPRLQRVLNLFRGCGELRYGLLCTKPHQEWVLITMRGPELSIEIHHECVFTNLADAEREIFRRRWKYQTNQGLC
ncbi:MAG: hypothetical protein LLG04_04745 [Parachlamydia sp.]|nr:hypothetical protein [Parachlamydia sp.]